MPRSAENRDKRNFSSLITLMFQYRKTNPNTYNKMTLTSIISFIIRLLFHYIGQLFEDIGLTTWILKKWMNSKNFMSSYIPTCSEFQRAEKVPVLELKDARQLAKSGAIVPIWSKNGVILIIIS